MDGLFVSTSPRCVSPRSSGAPIVPLKAKTASPSSSHIVVCASNFPLASRQWLHEDRAWPLCLCARHARGRKRKGRSQKTPHRGLATTCGVDGILVSACYVGSQKDLCTVLPLCVVTAAAHLNSPDTDVLYSPDQVGWPHIARTLQAPDYSEPLWLRPKTLSENWVYRSHPWSGEYSTANQKVGLEFYKSNLNSKQASTLTDWCRRRRGVGIEA